MTATPTTFNMWDATTLDAFAAFVRSLHDEFNQRITDAIAAAHAGDLEPGRAVLADHEALMSAMTDAVRPYENDDNRIALSDAVGTLAMSLVPSLELDALVHPGDDDEDGDDL